jgi:hypothetical protein
MQVAVLEDRPYPEGRGWGGVVGSHNGVYVKLS